MTSIWQDDPRLVKMIDSVEKTRRQVSLTAIPGPAAASFIAALKLRVPRPLLVIVPDTEAAVLWSQDLKFFLADPGTSMLVDRQTPNEPVIRQSSVGSVILFPELVSDSEESSSGGIFEAHLAASIYALSKSENPVCVIPAKFLATRYPAKVHYQQSKIIVAQGDDLDVSKLIRSFPEMGYERVLRVENPGEFSFRGGILDIYIPIYSLPVRFEFFGDEVVSVREFDTITQRSISRVKSAGIIPVTKPDNDSKLKPFLYQIEDWVGFRPMTVWVEPDRVLKKITEADPNLMKQSERTDLPGDPPIFIDIIEQTPLPDELNIEINVKSGFQYKGDYKKFIQDIVDWLDKGYRIRVIYRRESVRRLLEERIVEAEIDTITSHGKVQRIESAPLFVPGQLSGGFILRDPKWVFISEQDVIGKKKEQKWQKASDPDLGLSFQDLKPGDFVVHVDHGIGEYAGLHQLAVNGRQRDFLLILYAEKQKLYLPVERLDLIQRYIGSTQVKPSLDRLGGVTFSRKKKKVKESVLQLAAELLKLFSSREVIKGQSFSSDGTWHREFDLGFEYEETPDQIQAIRDVKSDMELDRPMDRLVCGDVGYGKTEVAMRAAFKAAFDGKQVAILVPTTILAQQHFRKFLERFRPFPIQVAMLSRFLKPGDAKKVKAGLADGSIDVVIGTHALLASKIEFKDLGLLIIDEEQRFGVKHKETLKTLRTKVDVLTLTATPIPRTLNMAMLGLRDISLINTPPESRKPVLTRVVKFDKQLIRQAILTEMERNGQVYIVHNRIRSIYAFADLIRKLVPEANLEIAHGQMSESKLENIMLRFLERDFNVLLSTTIIESGLDIPSVNTIIINRADTLGLAQLYQLRGRVGRDRYQAFAYLMVPASSAVSNLARERLAAIREAAELGSGFKLASRDMEIRGAGDIIGPNQHGQISAVGYEMYCQLVKETIAELKGEPAEDIRDPEIKLAVETTIPDSFVPEPAERLEIYRRFATARDKVMIKRVVADVSDRYGQPPHAIQNLADMTMLKLLAKLNRIEQIEQNKAVVKINFSQKTTVNPEKITSLLMQSKGDLGFEPPFTLKIFLKQNSPVPATVQISRIINELQ